MTPNKENIRKFVAALRSGDFKQGRTFLGRDLTAYGGEVEHCCIGVACRIAIADNVDIKVEKNIAGTFFFDDVSTSVNFPPKLVEWLGIPNRQLGVYAAMNDGRNIEYRKYDNQLYSFTDIANKIEKDYLS